MSEKNYTQSANYALIGKNKKSKVTLEFNKIPEVKEIILKILKEDLSFWQSKNQKQQGIEKFNLIKKVSEKIKINSNIIYLSLDELESEQLILFYNIDNKLRYIINQITH